MRIDITSINFVNSNEQLDSENNLRKTVKLVHSSVFAESKINSKFVRFHDRIAYIADALLYSRGNIDFGTSSTRQTTTTTTIYS